MRGSIPTGKQRAPAEIKQKTEKRSYAPRALVWQQHQQARLSGLAGDTHMRDIGIGIAIGLAFLAISFGHASIVVDAYKQKLDDSISSGVLVWRGKAYNVDEMGGRE